MAGMSKLTSANKNNFEKINCYRFENIKTN